MIMFIITLIKLPYFAFTPFVCYISVSVENGNKRTIFHFIAHRSLFIARRFVDTSAKIARTILDENWPTLIRSKNCSMGIE